MNMIISREFKIWKKTRRIGSPGERNLLFFQQKRNKQRHVKCLHKMLRACSVEAATGSEKINQVLFPHHLQPFSDETAGDNWCDAW